MDLDPWLLGETAKASCGLGSRPLGGEKGRLGLAERILEIALNKLGVMRSESGDKKTKKLIHFYSELKTPNF
jgi:hypothetical protein